MSERICSTHGLVLRAVRYGEHQVIVDVFTEFAGTVSFIVRQSLSGRKGARASVWQPLTLVEVVWEPRVRSSLQHPRELTLWHAWHSLHFTPYKTAMSLFLGEFLSYALREEQTNEPLFEYMVHALSWFDESSAHYSNFHVVFLLHLTRFLGFLPNVEDWEEGCYFDLEAATFTRACPSHVHYLNPEEASLVPKFLRMNYRSMQAVGLNGAMRRRALEIVMDFYRLHIPGFPELKSLEILGEVVKG
ncbi:MAG: DNA repair protein RecO [Bacteroidales bacterium]|nr:DNA repair protein RecO [Bacteroidales bacterium]